MVTPTYDTRVVKRHDRARRVAPHCGECHHASMDPTLVAALTLILAGLAVLVPWLLWLFPRSRVRIRIVWEDSAATAPEPITGNVPAVNCSVYNDGDSPAFALELWLSNEVPYQGSMKHPISVLPRLDGRAEPWVVAVPRQRWYWDQPHRGRYVSLHPDGQEFAERITATVGWRRYPDRWFQHTKRKTSPQPYD